MAYDGLEEALVATAESIEVAARASATAGKELKRAAAAAGTGAVRDLRKALAAAVVAARELEGAARRAQDAYDFDEAEHLASGRYTRELLALAAAQDLPIVEDDERLLCYPSLIRILPADAAIEVDRRRDKRLRPTVVLAGLTATAQRPVRFKAEQFLESLGSAYELLAAGPDKADPVLRLDAIWSVLTLLPGQSREYSKQEFARDLYQLDLSGIRTTKAGRTLRWHASSGTRGAGVLTTVAKSGQQQRYWGASFALS